MGSGIIRRRQWSELQLDEGLGNEMANQSSAWLTPGLRAGSRRDTAPGLRPTSLHPLFCM